MSKIRSSKTKFETVIFREIKKRRISFRMNYAKVLGKPDIALPMQKKAIFLHSDFWHGWQLSRWVKILPNSFWKDKLSRNRIRDKKVVAALRRKGWKVMVIWEHQIKKDLNRSIGNIVNFLNSK